MRFSGANLADIDFRDSRFVRCTFGGELRRIIFWDRPPNSDVPHSNPMEDVDFSRAVLHDVEFRGLRLDCVTLPSGAGHVVVPHYSCVLARGIERLSGVNTLAAVLAHERRWSHPLREVGIWHRDSLGETDEERDAMAPLLRDLAAECRTTPCPAGD